MGKRFFYYSYSSSDSRKKLEKRKSAEKLNLPIWNLLCVHYRLGFLFFERKKWRNKKNPSLRSLLILFFCFFPRSFFSNLSFISYFLVIYFILDNGKISEESKVHFAQMSAMTAKMLGFDLEKPSMSPKEIMDLYSKVFLF